MTARRTDQVSAFVKKAIIAGVGTKEHVDPVRYGLTRWGVDCPVFNQKAPIAGSGSLDGVFQSELQAFFSLVFEASVIGRLPGIRQVPIGVRLTSVVSGSTANWVRQGAAKPLSSAALASVPLAARKIVSLVVLIR